MRAAAASKPQIGFHTCQVFTHPSTFHSCVMDPPFSISDDQWKMRFHKLDLFSPDQVVKSFELKAASQACGRGKVGASWPSHCSVSVRHNLQQQVTAPVTTCQKAKVLSEHQPSVDTVPWLSSAWNCQLIALKHLLM